MFPVHVQPIFTTKITGTVSFEGSRMPGGQISIVGRDCTGNIRDGFFEISCEGMTTPIKIQIRVPELYAARVCTREVVLKALTNNELALEGCAKLALKSEGPQPHACSVHTPQELIRREAVLVRQHDLVRVINLFAPDAEIIDAQTGGSRSPRDRYQSEFTHHRFIEASHADIRHVKSVDDMAFYTSSSTGRFLDGHTYNNQGPSDHWILEKLGDCWRIKGLIINAAHDLDKRFTSTE